MSYRMSEKMKICFIYLVFLYPAFLFAQFPEEVASNWQKHFESIQRNNQRIQVPRFDAHFGIGKVNGLRAGGRVLVHKHISVEAAIGGPVPLGFIAIAGFPSELPIISLGINGHIWDVKNITFSLISTFLKQYNSSFQLSYLSLNVGVMNLVKGGTHFFIRVGPYFEVNSFRFNGDNGLNIDLGTNFVFE